MPLVRPVSESHGVSVLADHSHVDAAVTVIELLLVPAARNDTSFGVTATPQSAAVGGGIGAAACCVTFTVCPATAIDAARVVVPGLDAIVKVTLPLPVPVVPPVSTTHAASDCALHGQPATAVTVILPVPPVAGTLCSVAESSNVQGAAS